MILSFYNYRLIGGSGVHTSQEWSQIQGTQCDGNSLLAGNRVKMSGKDLRNLLMYGSGRHVRSSKTRKQRVHRGKAVKRLQLKGKKRRKTRAKDISESSSESSSYSTTSEEESEPGSDDDFWEADMKASPGPVSWTQFIHKMAGRGPVNPCGNDSPQNGE